MAVFRILDEHYTKMLPGGQIWRNNGYQWIEIPEGKLADALRDDWMGIVYEEERIPEGVAVRYLEEISAGNVEYALPDLRGKIAVLIGRGVSSEGFWERYCGGERFVRIGINPGSIPIGSIGSVRKPHPTDGMHLGNGKHFDVIATLDVHYFRQASQFLCEYHGPVVSLLNCKPDFVGPGTFYPVDKLMWRKPGLSFGLALQYAANGGAREIVCCGTDFDGEYGDLRAYVVGLCDEVRKRGTPLWRDIMCPFEEIGTTYEPA